MAGTLATVGSVYCERFGDGFWAEPVNALSNLAFLAAAAAAGLALRRSGRPFPALWDLWLLVALVGSVGVGSFLWHTLSAPWARLADVLPILLVMSVFLLSFLVRVASLSVPAAGAGLVVFHALNLGVQTALPTGFLFGSIFYLPAFAAFLLLAGYASRTAYPMAHTFRTASWVFAVALGARTLDQPLCSLLPLGTHFVWHLLTALTLYLLLTGLVPTPTARRRASPGR